MSQQQLPDAARHHYRHFVGREAEIKRFRHLLDTGSGRAVVIVGQQGMGKTTLAERLLEEAAQHPTLDCRSLWYEVTRLDTVDALMERMLEGAFAGADVHGSFVPSEQRRKQWKALLRFVPGYEEVEGLLETLKQQLTLPPWERFARVLHEISTRLEEHQRVLFVVDPEKYMKEGSAEAWRVLVRRLPDKVVVVLPQRPEDELASSREFLRLPNVERLPKGRLPALSEEAAGELVDLVAPGLEFPVDEVRAAVARYDGHPYALGAALGLLQEAEATPETLPADPDDLAREQWERISQESAETLRVFKAYAVLEVAVPAAVVRDVAEVSAEELNSLYGHPYFSGLLREFEDGYRRIYHSLLAEHVLRELDDESKAYHGRARDTWRQRLEESEPKDALAAQRLPEHVLVVDGEAAFAEVVALTSAPILRQLGLLQEDLALLQRARTCTEPGSTTEWQVPNELGYVAMTRGHLEQAVKHFQEVMKLAGDHNLGAQATASSNLGLIYRTRGDLDDSEKMHLKALEIFKKLERREGIATQYGNLGLIYLTRGDLDDAEKMHIKALETFKQLEEREGTANQYGNLGLIYLTRGDLDKAEKMLLKALEIYEQLGRREGMGSQYSNLGVIYRTRGDLDKAEKMHMKALQISETFGFSELTANQYGNLGLIYRTRGDLDGAEKMFLKALKIDKQLGKQEGMASQYGNLGLIYRTRGDLDGAEEMFLKALEIDKQLGKREAMANQHGNLGLIYQARGDLDEAEKMYLRALQINKQFGRREGIANDYCNLGLVAKDRGDLDEAERLLRKALQINKQLGRRGSMASQYGNLGVIYLNRGDLDEAEKMHRKALQINKQLGNREGMANQYGNLGLVAKDRGDLDAARTYWQQALDLFQEMGHVSTYQVVFWLATLDAS